MVQWRYIRSSCFDSKFGYVSINNIFALGFDFSGYSQSIILIFGYVYIVIVAPQSMSSDYFYLQKCAHSKPISCIFGIPTPHLNKNLLATLGPICLLQLNIRDTWGVNNCSQILQIMSIGGGMA
jgi:hypothetical protein